MTSMKKFIFAVFCSIIVLGSLNYSGWPGVIPAIPTSQPYRVRHVGDPGYLTLPTAVARLNTEGINCTLIVREGNYPLTTNLTINSNISLQVLKGADIQIATTKTLTINGTLDAGLYQIFSCTGTGKVVFGTGSIKKAFPEWWYGGGGDWRTAINAAIASLSTGTVRLDGAYTISNWIVAKSNVDLIGTGSIAPTVQTADFLIYSLNQSNIRVSGLFFLGGGAWTATPFANPRGGGNSVGFTNFIEGFYAVGSNNITVDHCYFTGLGRAGLEWATVTNSKVDSSYFYNIGTQAIALTTCTGVSLTGNNINGVHGNQTAAGDTTVANSRIADGVMFYSGCVRCTQTGGVVQDCKRIGTVFDGDSGQPLNDVIAVSGVSYFNMNSSRGTEANACVWSEPGKSKPSLIVSGCPMNNQGATQGNLSTGIVGYGGIAATGNNIQYFNSGVRGGDKVLLNGNFIHNNNIGVDIGATAAGTEMSMIGNDISHNTQGGVWVYDSHGTIRITGGNVFKDNGSGTVVSGAKPSAIYIHSQYTDQVIIINGNAFESSANQGDTVGQLHGIAGYDFSNWAYITNNTFLFTGTFSAVWPAIMTVEPCTLAYTYSGDNILHIYDIILANGNINSKHAAGTYDSYAGGQRNLGAAAAAPTTGTWLQGDYFTNSNPVSGQPIGWICTVDGTPGTWKGYGVIL